MSETCETCKYFRPNEAQPGYPSSNLGCCRIRSPHPEYGHAYLVATDWCGEFKAKEGGERINPLTRAGLEYYAGMMGFVIVDRKLNEALHEVFEASLEDEWRHEGNPTTV